MTGRAHSLVWARMYQGWGSAFCQIQLNTCLSVRFPLVKPCNKPGFYSCTSHIVSNPIPPAQPTPRLLVKEGSEDHNGYRRKKARREATRLPLAGCTDLGTNPRYAHVASNEVMEHFCAGKRGSTPEHSVVGLDFFRCWIPWGCRVSCPCWDWSVASVWDYPARFQILTRHLTGCGWKARSETWSRSLSLSLSLSTNDGNQLCDSYGFES